MVLKKEFQVLDLFAGAGGLSQGFKEAGFNIIAANEINPIFSKTYQTNHPETRLFTGDIRSISIEEFKNHCEIYNKKVDVIIGGPPCQGFSLAGRRDPSDPRNSLFMVFIRFINYFKPVYFVMENVPGILNMKTKEGELVREILFKEFRKIGYTVKAQKLHAADYGVPQKRKRVFFIGTNTDKQISFPDRTYPDKWVPVSSVLLSKNYKEAQSKM